MLIVFYQYSSLLVVTYDYTQLMRASSQFVDLYELGMLIGCNVIHKTNDIVLEIDIDNGCSHTDKLVHYIQYHLHHTRAK